MPHYVTSAAPLQYYQSNTSDIPAQRLGRPPLSTSRHSRTIIRLTSCVCPTEVTPKSSPRNISELVLRSAVAEGCFS